MRHAANRLHLTLCSLAILLPTLPGLASPSAMDNGEIHLPGVLCGPVSDGPRAALARSTSMMSIGEVRSLYPDLDGAGYTVAVIDTGVDYTHPALADRYLGGYDFVNNDANPMDDEGHGTHVAGIIASENATYTGIVPGANIVALKVLDQNGSGTWGDIEAALQWCVRNQTRYNIRAINMSLGTSSVYSTPATSFLSDEFRQLRDAGVVNACSSGNGYGSNHTSGGGVGYPAADPCTLSVGAVWTADFGRTDWSGGAIDYTTAADRIVSFTDRHADMLDILPDFNIGTPNQWSRS